MKGKKQNHYGKLCTEMYEILHDRTALEELEFYLSYADKDKKILEPLCRQRALPPPVYGAGALHYRAGCV